MEVDKKDDREESSAFHSTLPGLAKSKLHRRFELQGTYKSEACHVYDERLRKWCERITWNPQKEAGREC